MSVGVRLGGGTIRRVKSPTLVALRTTAPDLGDSLRVRGATPVVVLILVSSSTVRLMPSSSSSARSRVPVTTKAVSPGPERNNCTALESDSSRRSVYLTNRSEPPENPVSFRVATVDPQAFPGKASRSPKKNSSKSTPFVLHSPLTKLPSTRGERFVKKQALEETVTSSWSVLPGSA